MNKTKVIYLFFIFMLSQPTLSAEKAVKTVDFSNKTIIEIYDQLKDGKSWKDLPPEQVNQFLDIIYQYHKAQNPDLEDIIHKLSKTLSLQNGVLNIVVLRSSPENDIIAALIKAIDKDAIVIYTPRSIKPDQVNEYINKQLKIELDRVNISGNIKKANISFVHGLEKGRSNANLQKIYEAPSIAELPSEAIEYSYKFNPELDTMMYITPEKYATMLWSMFQQIEQKTGPIEIAFSNPACGSNYREVFYKIDEISKKPRPLENNEDMMGDKLAKQLEIESYKKPIASSVDIKLCDSACYNRSMSDMIEFMKKNPNATDLANIMYIGFFNGGYTGAMEQEWRNEKYYGTVPEKHFKDLSQGKPISFTENVPAFLRAKINRIQRNHGMSVSKNAMQTIWRKPLIEISQVFVPSLSQLTLQQQGLAASSYEISAPELSELKKNVCNFIKDLKKASPPDTELIEKWEEKYRNEVQRMGKKNTNREKFDIIKTDLANAKEELNLSKNLSNSHYIS